MILQFLEFFLLNLIKNNLIFKKGDKLSPRILAENERIIRSLPYMKDCKIVIRPNFMYSDSIDIEIRTRDIWSLIVKGSLENSKKYNFGLSEYNFFGLGNQFQMSSYIDHDWEKRYAFKYNYDVENLFGSFISLHLDRKNLFDIEENRIKIERLFKSDIFHYGGGIEFVGQKNLRIIDTDIKPFKTELHDQLNIYDMWVGKVFSLKKNSLEYNEKKQDQTSSLNKIIDEDIEISNYFSSVNSKYNLLNEEKNQNIFDKNSSPKVTIATRLQIDDYRYRPDVSLDSNREFHSNSLFLSSISLSSNIFYKTRYIYGFGSTEDIPIGSIIELTAGKEFGEFTDRFYIGFEIAKAKFLLTPFAKDKKVHNLNYLYGNLTVGSFIDNYIFSQSIIKSKINFISRLFSLSNTFGLRNFVNLGYIIGFNRYPNEYLKTLVEDQNSNGLDNLDIESIKGSQKLSLTYESVFFTPWNLYGFKITPFIFSDIAVMNSIKESNNLLKSHKFFTGVGSGFRLKNERIIFETIQLSFTYHPNSYTGVDDFRFNLEIEYKLNFNPFIGGKPALISYE